jgi:hypothetical protein
MSQDTHRTTPRWLPSLGAVLAGFQVFVWLCALLGFAGIVLVLAMLPSGALSVRLLGPISIMLAGVGVLAAAWVAVRVSRGVKRRLALASFTAAAFWAALLLLLALAGPAPFLYTLE